MEKERKIMVATGDSIMADIGISEFNDAAKMSGLNTLFCTSRGDGDVVVENTAIGGHTVEMIASRFRRDAVSFNPDIVVVNGGTNDLWGFGISDQIQENSWRYILDLCKESGIICAILSIVPASGFPNRLMQRRDMWNEMMRNLVSEYDGSIYIDADPYVGLYRNGGDENNLWDMKPEFDLDGVHYTRAGSVGIARAIVEKIKDIL